MKSPFPYFGGKSAIAHAVWRAFGGDVQNYVEPFFGSGAVLLSRPGWHINRHWTETVNDADGFIANFWRALKGDPESVAYWADYPVSETDLHARHVWLVNRRERLAWALEDPDYYDAKIAGWWVWGASQWIAGGWCTGKGPWIGDGAHIRRREEGEDAPGVKRERPNVGGGKGVHRKLPHLGSAGMGVHRQHSGLLDYLTRLSERLRHVRVCAGDWSRVLGDTPTIGHGATGVFMDPPYSLEAGRDMGCYAVDSGTVAHDVRAWCLAHGADTRLRIVLCGYEGEHDMPGWTVREGKSGGQGVGYGSQGNGWGRENAKRERLWLSPGCHLGGPQMSLLDPTHEDQDSLGEHQQVPGARVAPPSRAV